MARKAKPKRRKNPQALREKYARLVRQHEALRAAVRQTPIDLSGEMRRKILQLDSELAMALNERKAMRLELQAEIERRKQAESQLQDARRELTRLEREWFDFPLSTATVSLKGIAGH